MICPSCGETQEGAVKHCLHCGVAITRQSVQIALFINNCGWIARRALGGFFSGATGLALAAAVERTVRAQPGQPLDFTQLLTLFPGQSAFTAAVAGCFAGTVGGMIERSAYKSIVGGALGAIGGGLAGLAFPLFENVFRGYLYGYSMSLAAAWAVIGAFVGFSSGLFEGARNKMLVGIAGGFLGGACGGAIGSQMYGALLMEMGSSSNIHWVAGRALELAAGGIVGACLWSFLGLSEKLYIFRRRPMAETDKKICDRCKTENSLKAWYCGQCGAALQVAAARGQIRVTPYRGLERISNAFQFLSWLASTTGVVTGLVVFVTLLSQSVLFALFGALLVALGVYAMAVLFRALSDAVRMGIQIAEKPVRGPVG